MFSFLVIRLKQFVKIFDFRENKYLKQLEHEEKLVLLNLFQQFFCINLEVK